MSNLPITGGFLKNAFVHSPEPRSCPASFAGRLSVSRPIPPARLLTPAF
jgi:hypothetical protein